ncbi:hypothetical protein [Polaribacter sargassicola]|uniref:hypothetical protein n=1 Tax=Polaribacter sargassicola TaxID=2836891 RepID=UPI001F2E0F4B|nr:hypothetical protein [Polaribacter sp. DS7-9]MCG1037552.1 hypothetical protein [Polaribacter sp. DS7-9]
MHKKLEADLMSLAHSILKMKNKEDVFALKEKSKEVYEKLSLLAFVEEYVNTTPNEKKTKEELVSVIENAIEIKENTTSVENEEEEKVVYQLEEEPQEFVWKVEKEEEIEQPFDELIDIMHSEKEEVLEEDLIIEEELTVDSVEPIEEELEEEINNEPINKIVEEEVINDVIKVEENKIKTLEEELQDTISVDEIATLFDIPVSTQKSLNDRFAKNIQIGLNDRIAFVKNLFEGSQEDFNRVVSQLNTYGSETEAKSFINKMVKPDYDWSKQEELEARFLSIIERKFS